MAQTMTQGSLAKILIRFSIPLVLSGMLQQLYAWADAFIVGNMVGESALAAIGATISLSNLFVLAITGLALGVSVLCARLYGQGERKELKAVLSSFVVVLGGVFLCVGLGASLLTGRILALMDTPADIVGQARDYLQIILLGLPFVAVYNVYSAVLRGMGDSKAPLFAVLVASAVNVVLDLALVGGFGLGVRGAAVATVAAQVMMMVFIIGYAVSRDPVLRFKADRGCVSLPVLGRGLALGVPVAIQSCVSSLGSVVLQRFMNGFSSQTVAAITTAYRVDTMIMLPVFNLSSGISTVVAQNMGARKPLRAKKALWVGSLMMAVVALALTGAVMTAGGHLIAMFGVTAASTAIGVEFFHIIAWFYLIYGLAMALRGFLEGLGDVLFSSMMGIGALGVRIALSYAWVGALGDRVIAYAEAVSWCVMLLLYAGRFLCKGKSLLAVGGEGAG